MHKQLKFSIWFSVIIAAVFVVAWLWVREYSAPGPYDLEPIAAVKNHGADVDTSSWQTYRNEEYGFEVKYPPGWYINSSVHPIGYSFDDSQVNEIQSLEFTERVQPEFENTDLQGFFGIKILRDAANRDLDVLLSDFEHDIQTRRSVSINLGGTLAKRLSIFSGDFMAGQIFTLNKGIVFVLYFVESDPNDRNEQIHSKVYDQILSTFKFTE